MSSSNVLLFIVKRHIYKNKKLGAYQIVGVRDRTSTLTMMNNVADMATFFTRLNFAKQNESFDWGFKDVTADFLQAAVGLNKEDGIWCRPVPTLPSFNKDPRVAIDYDGFAVMDITYCFHNGTFGYQGFRYAFVSTATNIQEDSPFKFVSYYIPLNAASWAEIQYGDEHPNSMVWKYNNGKIKILNADIVQQVRIQRDAVVNRMAGFTLMSMGNLKEIFPAMFNGSDPKKKLKALTTSMLKKGSPGKFTLPDEPGVVRSGRDVRV